MAVFYKIHMDDGSTTDLTLNLGALMKLSRVDQSLVDRYMSIYKNIGTSKDMTEFEMGEIIYIAYRAAHTGETDPMSLEDFLYTMTDSRVEIASVIGQLLGTNQEKKQDLLRASRKQHGKGHGGQSNHQNFH